MKIADIKPILLPTKINKVDNNLYCGNAVFSPIKAYRIKKKGITQIIDLRHEDKFLVNLCYILEKFYCKILKIDYIKKNFYQNNLYELPNADYFDGLTNQINKSSKTYLHCHYGSHRTGFAVAMYQKSKGDAYDTIISRLMKNEWNTKIKKNY